MWKAISTWYAKQGGAAHIVAGVWLFCNGAYLSVPPFHQFVIDVWAKTPPDLRTAGLAAAGLYAWYTSTHKGAS